MSFWRKISATILSLAMVASLAALFYFLDYWYVIVAIDIFLAVGATAWYSRDSIHRDWVWLPASFLFASGSFAFVFLLREGIVRWFVLAALALVWFLYFYNLRAKPRADIGLLVSLAGFISLIYSSWHLLLLFALPLWLLLLFTLVAAVFLSWPLFRSGHKQDSFLYSLVLGFIMAQFVWAISFWPTSVLVDSVVLLLVFYLIQSLFLSYFLGNLDRKRVWQYIIVTGVLIAIILSTSNWLLPI